MTVCGQNGGKETRTVLFLTVSVRMDANHMAAPKDFQTETRTSHFKRPYEVRWIDGRLEQNTSERTIR